MGDEYRVFRMPAHAATGQPTFLLLHGIGLSHRSFTRTGRLLARHGDVIAIDLPGFGGTQRPQHPLSVEDYAAGITRILTRLAIGPVIAVGHSMGVQFALELAVSRPDLVDAVVMIGPVVDPRYRTVWQQGLRLIRDATLEPWPTQLMVQFDYARCGPSWFLTETRAMLTYPTHERIDELTRPLLVIRGDHDPIANRRWATWLASRAPDGTSRSIPGYRHNVVHSAAADTAQAIIELAERIGRTTSVRPALTAPNPTSPARVENP